MKWVPRPYQRRGVKFMLQNAVAAGFLDLSMGKTSIVLSAIQLLKDAGTLDCTLVIAPLRPCYLVWPAEIKKWDHLAGLTVEVLHGPHKDKALDRPADIYVINPAGMPWLLKKENFKKLKAKGSLALVVDESTAYKHTNTSRYKTLKPFLGCFGRRWGLTGEPAPNGMMDLYGQITLLDQGRAFGPYITHFRNTYFDATGFNGYTWVLKQDENGDDAATRERIYERIRPMTLRLSSDEHLSLPEFVPNTIEVELPRKARLIYEDMERDMLAMLEGGETVTSMSAAAASMKCRQVAAGGIYRDLLNRATARTESEEWVKIHDEKTEAVLEVVESLNSKPLLVAFDFRHDVARLRAALGKDVPVIGGGVSMSPKRLVELERAWNAGEIPVLLGHPQSMGHGLNFQGACCNVLWHSLTWDLELYNQFNGRVRRSGNPHPHIYLHHIIAKDTVDEAVMATLKAKGKSQRDLLEALKTNARRRAR